MTQFKRLLIRPFISRGIKIYTKTGDGGMTSLFSGERRNKNDHVFEALGNTDELNASIGLVIEIIRQEKRTINKKESLSELTEKLIEIQSRLFDLGAVIATPLSNSPISKITRAAGGSGEKEIMQSSVLKLETWIDEMDQELTPLKNFILPSGGGISSSQLHVARAICRRAERSFIPLLENEDIHPNIVQYINRLSDFLFISARYCALKNGKKETLWKRNTD